MKMGNSYLTLKILFRYCLILMSTLLFENCYSQRFSIVGQPSTSSFIDNDQDTLDFYTNELNRELDGRPEFGLLNVYYGEIFNPLVSTNSGKVYIADLYNDLIDRDHDLFILFVNNPRDQTITVKFTFPRSMEECLDEARKQTIISEIEVAANEDPSESMVLRLKKGILKAKKKLSQIRCYCQDPIESCFLPEDFQSANSRLLSLGFRKKEVSIVGVTSNSYTSIGIKDYIQKEIQIDGVNYNIVDQIKDAKIAFNDGLNGYVGLYDFDHFIDFEGLIQDYKSNVYDYIEVWFVLTDLEGRSFLYSRFFIKGATFPPGTTNGGTAVKGGLEIRNENLAKEELQILGNCVINNIVNSILDKYSYTSKNDLGDNFVNNISNSEQWEGLNCLLPWLSTDFENNAYTPIFDKEDNLIYSSVKRIINGAVHDETCSSVMDDLFEFTKEADPLIVLKFCLPISYQMDNNQFVGCDKKIYNLGNGRPISFTDNGYLYNFEINGKIYWAMQSATQQLGFANCNDMNGNYTNSVFNSVKFENPFGSDVSSPRLYRRVDIENFEVIDYINGNSIGSGQAYSVDCPTLQHLKFDLQLIKVSDGAQNENPIEMLNDYVSLCESFPFQHENTLSNLASEIISLPVSDFGFVETDNKIHLIKDFACFPLVNDLFLNAIIRLLQTSSNTEIVQLVHVFDLDNYYYLFKILKKSTGISSFDFSSFSIFISLLSKLIEDNYDELNVQITNGEIVEYASINGISYVQGPIGLQDVYFLQLENGVFYSGYDKKIKGINQSNSSLSDNNRIQFSNAYDIYQTGQFISYSGSPPDYQRPISSVSMNITLNPFEPIYVSVGKNYPVEGFDGFKVLKMPAVWAYWADLAIDKADFDQDVRAIGNKITITLAILTAPETGALLTFLEGASAVIAALDLCIQKERNSLSVADYNINKDGYDTWDAFRTAGDVVTLSGGVGIGIATMGKRYSLFKTATSSNPNQLDEPLKAAKHIISDKSLWIFDDLLTTVYDSPKLRKFVLSNIEDHNLLNRLNNLDAVHLSRLERDALDYPELLPFIRSGGDETIDAWKYLEDAFPDNPHCFN